MQNRFKYSNNNKGLTLTELIIALSLSAALIVSVYYFWAFLNRHTYTHTQNTLLSAESYRIINSLAKQLQNASAVLYVDVSSVQFVTSKGDTLQYEFDGDSLRINDNPLSIINKGAVITNFEIHNINENEYREAEHTLLEITLTMQNLFNYTSSVLRSIRIPKPVETSTW